MTYHSKSKNALDRVRATLEKLELEMARVECEIAVAKEKINFHSASTKQSDVKAVIDAKIDKENYEVFYNRLGTYKVNLERKIKLVAEKYQGAYAGVFEDFFFQKLPVKEIAAKYNLTVDNVWKLAQRMRKEFENEV